MTLTVTKEKGPFWIKKDSIVWGGERWRLNLWGATMAISGNYGGSGGEVYTPKRVDIGPGETKTIEYLNCRFKIKGSDIEKFYELVLKQDKQAAPINTKRG